MLRNGSAVRRSRRRRWYSRDRATDLSRHTWQSITPSSGGRNPQIWHIPSAARLALVRAALVLLSEVCTAQVRNPGSTSSLQCVHRPLAIRLSRARAPSSARFAAHSAHRRVPPAGSRRPQNAHRPRDSRVSYSVSILRRESSMHSTHRLRPSLGGRALQRLQIAAVSFTSCPR